MESQSRRLDGQVRARDDDGGAHCQDDGRFTCGDESRLYRQGDGRFRRSAGGAK